MKHLRAEQLDDFDPEDERVDRQLIPQVGVNGVKLIEYDTNMQMEHIYCAYGDYKWPEQATEWMLEAQRWARIPLPIGFPDKDWARKELNTMENMLSGNRLEASPLERETQSYIQDLKQAAKFFSQIKGTSHEKEFKKALDELVAATI